MHPTPAPSIPPSGWLVVRRSVVPSTQDVLGDLLNEAPRDRCVVVAGRQTLGRGRRGSSWVSPPGGLYGSLSLLRPRPPDPFLGLILAGAIIDSLRDSLPPSTVGTFGIKWPNDLWVNERKWGGILTEVAEMPPGRVIYRFGVGLNLDIPREALPAELPVTSILAEFGASPSPDAMLSLILSRFDECLAADHAQGRESSRRRLERELITRGRTIRWSGAEGPSVGFAEGLESDGSLRVRLDGAGGPGPLMRLYAETVEHVRTDD